jgi:AcrR family transcriptional regulator
VQYQKDEIRNNILISAKNEFLNKGFKGASMRDISKNAGVALGNVYRYFKNKEDLFNTIVRPVHDELIKMIFSVGKHEIHTRDFDVANVIDGIMKIYEIYGTELIIIMEKSQGSQYSNMKNDLIKHLNKRLSEQLFHMLSEVNHNVDIFFINVISSMLVEGAFLIFERYKEDKQKISINIALLVSFCFNDILKRMEMGLSHVF